MATDLDIINGALTLLGEDAIEAITSDTSLATWTDRGNAAALLYPDEKATWLSARWAFNTKRALLTAVTAPISEWRYAHALPSDSLAVHGVFAGTGINIPPLTEYQIEGGNILSNQASLYLVYAYDVTEASWPADLVAFARVQMASVLAIPVTENRTLMQQFALDARGNPPHAWSGGLWATARQRELGQQGPLSLHNGQSPLVSARLGGYYRSPGVDTSA